MNYQKLHDRLVAIGRQRGTKERPGFELHHVTPECMGGSDDESNKALLTFHEHFVVHRLLTKLHPGHSGLLCAVWQMTTRSGLKKSGRAYEKARQDFIDNHPQKTPEARAAVGQRMSVAWSGDSNPNNKLENRKANGARQRRLHAEGKLVVANQGDKHPMLKAENKAASSERAKKQVQCPHCCKVGQNIVMGRHHFDNCPLLASPGSTCELSEAANWLSCLDCDRFFRSQGKLTKHRNKKHKGGT